MEPLSATAAGAVYLSTTGNGLPFYSSEPRPDSRLHLVISPPPRPRAMRIDVPRMRVTAPQADVFSNLASHGIDQLSRAAAKAYQVPHELILAVMHAESAFNPAARSHAGAIGLMQIMPMTGRRYGVSDGLANPASNIDVGTRYLRDLLHLFEGNVELALAAYNAGEGAVMRHGRRIPPYAETQQYVPRVMSLYRRYRDREAEGRR